MDLRCLKYDTLLNLRCSISNKLFLSAFSVSSLNDYVLRFFVINLQTTFDLNTLINILQYCFTVSKLFPYIAKSSAYANKPVAMLPSITP